MAADIVRGAALRLRGGPCRGESECRFKLASPRGWRCSVSSPAVAARRWTAPTAAHGRQDRRWPGFATTARANRAATNAPPARRHAVRPATAAVAPAAVMGRAAAPGAAISTGTSGSTVRRRFASLAIATATTRDRASISTFCRMRVGDRGRRWGARRLGWRRAKPQAASVGYAEEGAGVGGCLTRELLRGDAAGNGDARSGVR